MLGMNTNSYALDGTNDLANGTPNRHLDSDFYVDTGLAHGGETVTFSGTVESNSLPPSVEAYACVDNSSGNGFTLPLLHTGGEGPWLVQQADESTDRVIAFKFVDGDLASIEPAPDPVDVRIGEPQIYAFIEGNNLYLGPKSVIEPSLRSFVLANPAELATAVQVFRIIGTVYEKRRARTQMKNLIEKCTGAAAANSFVMSDLAGAFWTKLSAAWFLSDDPERRHLLRS